MYLEGGDSYFAVPAIKGRWLFTLSMEIRPKERDALIFSSSGRRFAEDCLILDMNDGRLELRYVKEKAAIFSFLFSCVSSTNVIQFYTPTIFF